MNSSSDEGKTSQGLGSRVLLDKVDKLRELGISHLVPLPQIVVVGDHGAGKSSVLESLTGFQFPRSATPCTRHATEIVCRREPAESVVVSIIPHNPSPEREKLVREFRPSTDKITSDDFLKIFEDAAIAMDIKISGEYGNRGSAFSLDILKVEINHPNAAHLTVTDVPGMFETVTPTPGVITESDIDMVKNMVKRYIQQTRTIILTVVPCNSDVANQNILRLAAEVDSNGERILGVLTKPDLGIENATKAVVCDHVKDKRGDLHLGYCVVKSPGADDKSGTMNKRQSQEQALFGEAPWNTLPTNRLVIPALRIRLEQLLMNHTRAEFLLVKDEIRSSLKKREELLKDLGESRSTTDQQRVYVGKIASEFMRITHYGLDAYYRRHSIFEDAEMRLITRIRSINEAFAHVMYQKGHAREFYQGNKKKKKASRSVVCRNNDDSGTDSSISAKGDEVDRSSLYDDEVHFEIPKLHEGDLRGIMSDPYRCPEPETDKVALHMSADQLNSIAAEDQAVKEKREALTREIEALRRVLQILRS